ncbi:MAG: hypothetical protein HDR16_08315 [Lachnospiraceae bacterium]|nr:hypothetical protein [Lachnospiraceae bacterium]
MGIETGLTFDLDEVHTDGREAIVFGAGMFGKHIVNELLQRHIVPTCICDNNQALKGTEYHGFPVIPYRELPKKNYLFVLGVADWPIQEAVLTQLLGDGVALKDIVMPLFYGPRLLFDERILMVPGWAEAVVLERGKRRKKQGRQFAEYFLSNDLRRIQFYGEGVLADWLEQEIDGSSIVMEMRAGNLQEVSGAADAIVVADQARYIYLEEELMDIVDCPIIDVWSVVR